MMTEDTGNTVGSAENKRSLKRSRICVAKHFGWGYCVVPSTVSR